MTAFPPADLDELREVALAAARAGAAVALDWRRRPELQMEEKSGAWDLVSQADRDSEAAVLEVLAQRRPGDAVLGEEGGSSGPADAAVVWVVDPIDGTTNYLYGLDQWAVSVAAVERASGGLGRVLAGAVLEPATGRETVARLGGGTTSNGVPVRVRATRDLRHALIDIGFGSGDFRSSVGALAQRLAFDVRDVRRGGSAATSLAQVATGRAEGYWGPGIREWDVAAGALLVTEAGGTVGTLDGPVNGTVPEGRACLAAGPALFEPLRSMLAEVYAHPG